MRQILRSLVRLAFGLAFLQAAAPPAIAADVVTSRFEVTGMHCATCEQRIERVIGKLDGVVGVEASAGRKLVVVEHDLATITIEELEEAVERLGYEAELAPEAGEGGS